MKVSGVIFHLNRSQIVLNEKNSTEMITIDDSDDSSGTHSDRNRLSAKQIHLCSVMTSRINLEVKMWDWIMDGKEGEMSTRMCERKGVSHTEKEKCRRTECIENWMSLRRQADKMAAKWSSARWQMNRRRTEEEEEGPKNNRQRRQTNRMRDWLGGLRQQTPLFFFFFLPKEQLLALLATEYSCCNCECRSARCSVREHT